MNRVLEMIDYFVEETRGEIPICCTDPQSPFDTALLMWESSNFFISMMSVPETVHHVLDIVTETTIEFAKKQMERIGSSLAQPGHIMCSARGATGYSISDDNIVMVSPDQYTEFSVPYNERLAKAFGGLAVHSCGNYERQLNALLRTQGLMMVDGKFMGLDPTPNTDLELFRDTMKDTGIILQARVPQDWQPIVSRLYEPGMRLALVAPGAGPGESKDKNRVLLDEALGR
jgi:uroporphyrinogen-III decarboxylase